MKKKIKSLSAESVAEKEQKSIKKYTLESTSNKDLFRIMDSKGDWRHYLHAPSNLSLRAVSYILDNGYAKGIGFYMALKNASAEEWDKKLKSAGDRGDAVHQAIKNGLEDGKFYREMPVFAENNRDVRLLSDDEWYAVLVFARFWQAHGFKLIAKEKSVFNLAEGYAGTIDLIARATKECEGLCGKKGCKLKEVIGKLGLWDHKSGAGIYPNYGAQLASYAKADLTSIIGKHKIEYTATDRVGTRHNSGYELEVYGADETETHWEEFLSARKIADATYKPFVLENENEETPASFDVKIEVENLLVVAKKVKKVAKKVKEQKIEN